MTYFDGQCHKCGTFGHKMSQCPQWSPGYAHFASPTPHTQYAPEYSKPTFEEQHAFETANLNAELEQVELSEGDYSDQYGFEDEPTEHYL